MTQITREMLDDMDRNARAYGWEIGRGKPLTTEMDMSPDNPFTDKNWKDNVVDKAEAEAKRTHSIWTFKGERVRWSDEKQDWLPEDQCPRCGKESMPCTNCGAGL